MNVTDRQTDDGRIAYIEPKREITFAKHTRFDFKMINTAGLGNTFIIYRRLHKNYLYSRGEHD